MLGCQDFCGYYDWTFHYLRRKFGQAGLEKYWEEAIAANSQRHYVASAKTQGLRGLYESWSKTGVDEQCDWSVTLDESCNQLRLDMRQCPSKGYLLDHDLNADEDYCDHCMGWIGPALRQAGIEVAAHEHNHCGQCWWEIRRRNENQPPVKFYNDIKNDARWGHGYLHRFVHHEKLPIIGQSTQVDSCDVLAEWFRFADVIAVLGPEELDINQWSLASDPRVALIVSAQRFAAGECPLDEVRGVLINHDQDILVDVARQFHAAKNSPLLMHSYLPGRPILDFAPSALPRPVPILPILIRSGIYTHQAGRREPEPHVFAVLLAAALQKMILLRAASFIDFSSYRMHGVS